MSEFSGINTALTGLLAAQQAMDVTGENVTNANTPGYVRERVNLEPVESSGTPGIYSGPNALGQGVTVQGVERLGDQFLEARSSANRAASADLTATNQMLTNVQNGFAEPGANGLSTALADFWSSWDSVANNPTDLAARNTVIGTANTAAGLFNSAVTNIKATWNNGRDQVMTAAAEVNATASTIAQLNNAIRGSQAGGSPNGSLIDQRGQLVDQLASSVGATVHNNADGTVDVSVGGSALVRGATVSTLAATETAGGVQLQWSSGLAVAVQGGSVHGLLTALNSTIPGYLGRLTGIATTFAAAVNGQQAKGFTLATPPAVPLAGPPMLAVTSQPGSSAGEPAVPQLAVVASFTPDQVAASGSVGATGDGSNAQATAALSSSPTGADAVYRSFIGGLGSDVQRSAAQLTIQQSVTRQSDAALQSAEGVNTDEELTNMVAFQRAYQASAKVLTTIDTALDSLINVG